MSVGTEASSPAGGAAGRLNVDTGHDEQAVNDAVNVIGVAALLARDEHAMRFAVERAEAMQRKNSSLPTVVDVARHRLDLLAGEAISVDNALAAGETP